VTYSLLLLACINVVINSTEVRGVLKILRRKEVRLLDSFDMFCREYGGVRGTRTVHAARLRNCFKQPNVYQTLHVFTSSPSGHKVIVS
jgi:hypothetical protein